MEAYIIFNASGGFFRVEHNKDRAENFRLAGNVVESIALQKKADGFEGENSRGRLTISAGQKVWTPKSQSAKRFDKLKDDE